MTTITGKLVDAAGAAVRGETVRGVLVAATEVLSSAAGQIIRDTSTVSGDDGTWALTLTPTSGLVEDGGAYYLVMASGHRWTIDVPDTGSHDIGDAGILTVPGALDGLGATKAELAAHAAETTAVHGITDTGTLVTAAAVIADDSYARGVGGARGVEGRTPAQVLADIGAMASFLGTLVSPEPGRIATIGSEVPAAPAVGDRFVYQVGHAQAGELYRWDGVAWVLLGTIAAPGANQIAQLVGSELLSDHTIAGDLTISDPGVKGYRLRRSGSALDLDGGGADLFLSIFELAGFTGGQHTYLRLEAAAPIAHAVGRWLFGSTAFGGTVLDVDAVGAALGFYGAAPAVKPTVTGSRGGNAALASLLTALAGLGLITNSTTA